VHVHIFGETVLFRIGELPLSETMLTSFVLSLGIVWLAVLLRRAAASDRDSTPAALAFLALDELDGMVREIAGRPEPRLVTLAGSLFLFIAVCNLAGVFPGVRAPTASLATTSALAAIVFFSVPIGGIAARGILGYLAHYLRPNPLLLPLHLISELSRTLALSVRLFGNMMSGHMIVALLVALTGFLVPMPLMALDVLIGLIQAYIFTVLATVYVGAAIRAGEESET
jgi:F-type H+-transporting ATPase subunit a